MTPDPQLPATVLYVEDDEATRNAVASSLSRRVTRVITAGDGATALELFRTQSPDIVVTDIAMPGLSGLALARAIKAQNHKTPVILTTAHSDIDYFLEAIDLGVDAYVLKPVSFPALFQALRRCFAVLDHERQEQRYHAERDRLIEELRDALAKVKLLSGLLPICSACKKIRDDKGYWQQIEGYLREHSEARFSHGICPECVVRLYPELSEDPK